MSDEGALDRLAEHMDAEQRAALCAAMTAVDIEPGVVLFADGQPLDALHVVVSGAIDLSIDVGGKPVLLGHVAAKDFCGELSLLDTTTAYATATAREKSRVLRLTRAALDKLRRSNANVASLLLRALVEDLAERVRAANTVAVETTPPKRGWLETALANLFGGRA
jgi:CRP-like cAMP-binding protein